MKYALLAYSKAERSGDPGSRRLHPGIASVLERPEVTGYMRLEPPGSAGTVRRKTGATLVTDGPFVDSKEFLGGLILVDADNLEDALAVAAELQDLDLTAAIEVRPVFEQEIGGA
jgi:hypothetical protein